MTATLIETREQNFSWPEPPIPPPAGPPPSPPDRQPRADAPRPRDAWHERHPVIGVILAMVLFGVGGLAVSALVLRCATFAVAFT